MCNCYALVVQFLHRVSNTVGANMANIILDCHEKMLVNLTKATERLSSIFTGRSLRQSNGIHVFGVFSS